MMPLISSQVSSSEGTWWLLDSGAATSVLSRNYEGIYRCQAQEDSAGALETYYAANGTPVHMRANVLASLSFQVVTGASGKKKTQSFKLACCIGDVSHNIISTTHSVGQEGLESAFQRTREIPTPYGLNDTIQMGWAFRNPHSKMGEPDVQDYAIAQTESGEVAPGPHWQHLYRWLIAQAHEILTFDSVYLITDNRDLTSSQASTRPHSQGWHIGPLSRHGGASASNMWEHTRRKQQCCLCLFVKIQDCHLSTLPGRAPSSSIPAYTSSRLSTLPSLTATVSRSPSLNWRSCGLAIAYRNVMQRWSRPIHATRVRWHQHTSGRDQSILAVQPSNMDLRASSPSLDVQKTWRLQQKLDQREATRLLTTERQMMRAQLPLCALNVLAMNSDLKNAASALDRKLNSFASKRNASKPDVPRTA